ncbi:MAG TPA: phage holin family protein [Prolixibacteraceae bacterium]|nr:phage holin family protein [Prolixibacteraceae bacterium]
MEDKSTPVEVLLERAQAYTKTSIELFKLKATDKFAELTSNLASGFAILVILVLFFVNLNIAIALLIGDVLGKAWLGFILVSGLYACIGLFIYIFRNKWIKVPVSNSIIEQLLKDDQMNDDHIPE